LYVAEENKILIWIWETNQETEIFGDCTDLKKRVIWWWICVLPFGFLGDEKIVDLTPDQKCVHRNYLNNNNHNNHNNDNIINTQV